MCPHEGGGKGPGRRRGPMTRRRCWALCPPLTPRGSEDTGTQGPVCEPGPVLWVAGPPCRAAVRTQQEMEETPWGSQRPTLEEIIHKRLCKAARPHLIQAVSGPRSVQRIFALQALHRDKPTPGSQLLTGAVTGHETERKANEKATSRPRSPPWGTQGRRLARCPQADPHRWPVFHSCTDKSGHGESESPVGRQALPFPSRTQVTIGNPRESQPRPPPNPTNLPCLCSSDGHGLNDGHISPIFKEEPQSHKRGPGHIPGVDR